MNSSQKFEVCPVTGDLGPSFRGAFFRSFMAQEASIISQEKENKRKVLKSYLSWFFASLVLMFAAIYCVTLTDYYFPLISKLKKGFQLFGLLFAVTALGKREYDMQTWSGKSPAEKLNKRLFLTFSCIGLFLTVFSIVLS